MALGEDAVQRGARPWQISFNRPGDGYLWDSESNTVRYIHVPFMTDQDIHSLRRPGTDDEAGEATAGARSHPTNKLWGLLRPPPLADHSVGLRDLERISHTNWDLYYSCVNLNK